MYQKSVSTSTISRHLHEYGYKNVLPKSTHMLTSDEKERRVQWAEKYKNDDFNNTIFTDEASFQLFRNTIRRWTKTPNKELKCLPKNRQKIHIWGAISVKGVLTCHTFRCNLDDPYYVSILEDYLLPAVRHQFGRNWRLQQDNDPKHRSHICTQLIDEEVPDLIDWPSNSPDVNPIENIWAIVKRNVEKRKPVNIDELELFLAEEFRHIDTSIVKNCVMSMKKRCLSLIDCEGERIKY